MASTKLDRYLDQTEPHYQVGQPVQLLLTEQTPLGFKAIIEGAHWGLLYQGTVPAPLAVGQRLRGFVRDIRSDGKIDLSLEESGYKRIAPLTEQILEALKLGAGRLELDDSSAPEAIREAFGVSKKAFKQALGALFRARRIQFSNGATVLASRSPDGR